MHPHLKASGVSRNTFPTFPCVGSLRPSRSLSSSDRYIPTHHTTVVNSRILPPGFEQDECPDLTRGVSHSEVRKWITRGATRHPPFKGIQTFITNADPISSHIQWHKKAQESYRPKRLLKTCENACCGDSG